MRLRGLPLPARRFVQAMLAAGLLTALAALAALPAGLGWRHAALALAVAAGCFLLQARSPTLVWRGQRIAIHPDEAVLLVGVLVLPPPVVVLAAAAGSVAAQARLRKPLVKAAFNVASQTWATGLGALAFVGADLLGAPALVAALAVPPVVSAANQLAVAWLLSRLAGDGWRSVLTPALGTAIVGSTVAATLVGLLALALLRLHPAALLLLAPAGFLAHRAMVWVLHRENEMTTRRALARVGRELVGREDEESLVRSVLEACRDAFAPESAGVLLTDGPAPRTWRLDAGGPAAAGARTRRLARPLLNEEGRQVGELWLVVHRTEAAQVELDAELVGLVAASLSLGLANARHIRSVRQSEQRLREAFDAAPGPVFVLAPDARVLAANRHGADLVSAHGGVLGGALDEASWAGLREAAAAGLPRQRLLLATRGQEGEARVFEADVAPFTPTEGERACLCVAKDVTEQRRLEAEAERQREALARAERLSALGTLVAGVAHEVNNPLMYMGGSLDLLMLDLDDMGAGLQGKGGLPGGVEIDEMRRRLETVRAGCDRIQRITRQLRVVARSGTAESHEPLALAGLLADVERLVRPALPPGVRLAVEAASEACVRGSHDELHQVFLNLVKNAVEAVEPAGGHVRMRLWTSRDEALVEVQDDGPGIPPEARGSLFMPFFTTKPDGTGLGLPAAHAIVKNHGGAIEVESEAGAGASFRVRLPLAPRSGAPRPDAPPPGPRGGEAFPSPP